MANIVLLVLAAMMAAGLVVFAVGLFYAEDDPTDGKEGYDD